MIVHTASFACSLGYARVTWTRRGLRTLDIAPHAEALPSDDAALPGDGHHPWVHGARALLDGIEVATPPLDLEGTPFQREVWQALLAIPPGQTTTYQALAARLQRPQAARALGGAVGANPIAVVVPCHRVIRQDGGIGGYRWGLDLKQALLARERAVPQLDLFLAAS